MANKRAKSKTMDQNTKSHVISLRAIEAAESLRSLIHSLSLSLEERVAMEDQIKELSHKSNSLLDIISNSKKNYQKKLFFAYREFLKRNIDAVNERVGEL
jgi:hypothetical protein